MPFDSPEHQRRSTRLLGRDYSQPGAYFVTICTKDRALSFGQIARGEMQTNVAGSIAEVVWRDLPHRFSTVSIDVLAVMPNHIHGIVLLQTPFVEPLSDARAPDRSNVVTGSPRLGQIVRAYKAVTTHLIRRSSDHGFSWQRNYYEHIIRGEESLMRIRQYILDNPAQWASDRENPLATLNAESESGP